MCKEDRQVFVHLFALFVQIVFLFNASAKLWASKLNSILNRILFGFWEQKFICYLGIFSREAQNALGGGGAEPPCHPLATALLWYMPTEGLKITAQTPMDPSCQQGFELV